MTVVGIDDTDSRTGGMCTTYLGALLADALRAEGATVDRLLLVRCNPAVPHKTRGNAAVALHTDCDPERAFSLAEGLIGEYAIVDDPKTNPGLVVTSHGSDAVPEPVAEFAHRAVTDHLGREEARVLCSAHGYRFRGWENGRGLIGSLAAVGSWPLPDPTYERIVYRERERWGTDREVDPESVFAAADASYPRVWDTVDRATGDVVCVPNTPCPVLYGIRGDDTDAVLEVAELIESEAVERAETFVTNQGTDAHLREAPLSGLESGYCYRSSGTVASDPETRAGGHVFFTLESDDGETEIRCAAFEPTKRFRDRVRALRPGDRLAVCGEVSGGTLKLEKFASRGLNRFRCRNPRCPDCGRSMESAGRDQGYRCRECRTSAPGKERVEVDRDLEIGWYEVPPTARRHVAKPLVRGGFDAQVHPER
ncbi:tRNA(Ile)(2)-agmatinylcytidine synthase [Natronorarus salvus]|uniref:tRNA(Ile)(2)-agmatinylcytidine synthase n=1 Tax=Natronorarus salvus TaxID=3117733 RepID=UPI002F265B1B